MPGFVVFAQEKDAKPDATSETTTSEKPGKGEPGSKAAPESPFGPLFLMGAIFFVFYFIVLRPQRRRAEQERQSLTTNLNKNDRVLTMAGIYGTVVTVSDKEDEVVVKVDDNTRLKMQKASIVRNLTREEAIKAEKEQKEKDKTK